MHLTPNAIRVLQARYLRRNLKREIVETPDQLFRRVARAIAKGELEWSGEGEFCKWQINPSP